MLPSDDVQATAVQDKTQARLISWAAEGRMDLYERWIRFVGKRTTKPATKMFRGRPRPALRHVKVRLGAAGAPKA